MATYTTNYNLKKPADADSYDIADANGNMDIIDGALNTLNNQIATYNIGSNTLANLETALATLGSSLSNKEVRPIMMSPSAASGPFSATSYYGTIRRDSNGRYNATLQGMQKPEQVVFGNYLNGEWSWSSPFGYELAYNTAGTYSVTLSKGIWVVTFDRYTVSSSTSVGLYYVDYRDSGTNNNHVSAIKESSALSAISVGANFALNFTTTTTYMAVNFVKIQ